MSFFYQVDFVKSFCYLENRLNASGESEAAVTSRTKIGWIKFREFGKLLYRKKFLLTHLCRRLKYLRYFYKNLKIA